MTQKKEDGSRALAYDKLEKFFTEPTSNAECLIGLIKAHIGDGHRSISMCLRGTYVSVYYRCGQLLKIIYQPRKRKIVGLFNFRYALPHPNAEKYRSELSRLGVKFGNNEKEISVTLDGSDMVESDNLEAVLNKYLELIDYWIEHKTKNEAREKDRQQQLFSMLFGNSENTYFDIEYKEPRDTLIAAGYYDFAGEDYEAKKAAFKERSGGRFDFLGLRKAGEKYVLQFVELKSTAEACDDDSGVLDHITDYTKYCRYDKLVDKRKSDAVYIVNFLSHVFRDGDESTDLKLEDIVGHEIVFVFTDAAVKRVDTYRQRLTDENIKIVCYDRELNIIEQ